MAPNPPFVASEIPSAAKWNSLVGTYTRATTTVDVVSTATETTLFSQSVGAGHMSSDRMLRLTLLGDYLNNTGASEDPRLRVKWGGTTIWDQVPSVIGSNANRRPFRAVVEIANLNSATSQYMSGVMAIGSANATVGIGSANPADAGGMIASAGLLSVNTASAAVIAVTAQHDTSSANLSLRVRYGILELL